MKLSHITMGVSASLLILVSCSESHGTEEPRMRQSLSIRGKEIVAVVGSTTIRAEEVRRRMRIDGTRANVALKAIESDVLLAQEAEKRGMGNRPNLRRAMQQTIVQEFLTRTIETEVLPEQLEEEEVHAAYVAKRSEHKASTTSETEALADVRKELLVKARFQRLGQVLRALREAHSSEVSPQADAHLAKVADL